MKRFFALALIVLVLTVSCGKKEVKKVSEDSKISANAFALAETIKEAYIKKDFIAIENNTTKSGFKVINSALKSFDSAELTFNPIWLEIEDSVVHLNVSWSGKWQKSGKTTEEKGMAVFVMNGTPLKVDNILRANPFKYPE